MNTELNYYQVHTIKELVATYYVKAESREEAEELAWSRFDEEKDRLQLEDCWEHQTITDTASSEDSDEWLIENDEGYAVYVADNNGGEV
jgi:hypothetical protein